MYCLGCYNHFIVRAYPRLSITKGRKVIRSNPKWLSKIGDIQRADTEVDTGKAKGNDKGRKERNSPMNPNRHGQGLDTGCGGCGLWECRSAKVDKG
jgi:hypothetical protein